MNFTLSEYMQGIFPIMLNLYLYINMTAMTFCTTQECFLPVEMPIKSREFYDVRAINIARNLALCKHDYLKWLLKPLFSLKRCQPVLKL